MAVVLLLQVDTRVEVRSERPVVRLRALWMEPAAELTPARELPRLA